jgi:hypothetical protein
MEYMDELKRAVKLHSEARKLEIEASRILGKGPEHFFIEKLLECADEFFKRCSPFHAGDKIKLIKNPSCTGGWKSSEHFLKVGARGTIESTNFINRKFVANILFDDESYIRSVTSDIVKVKESDKRTYMLSEDYLEVLNEQ